MAFPAAALLGCFLSGLAMLGLIGCHDSPRHNPVDPELTPAVALQAALDDSTGDVSLSWSLHRGDEPFYQYWVLRRASGQTRVDTLAAYADITQTNHRDTALTPGTAYLYRVSVVTRGGFEQPSVERAVSGYLVDAVQLQPLLIEATTGSVTLTWTRFADPGFESYEVCRREVGTDQTEVLVRVAEVADTIMVDTSGRHQVTYAYEVLTRAAGLELTSNSVEGQVILPAVTMGAPGFSSADASATLTWTPYEGPGFARYEVRRRTAQLAARTVHTTAELGETSLLDAGLRGNTEYLYQVVVVTQREEEIAGPERGGALHRLVATWDMPWEGLVPVRLTHSESGAVVAVIEDGESEGIRRVVLGPSGVAAEPAGHLLRELRWNRYQLVSGYGLAAGPDPLDPSHVLVGTRFGTVLVEMDDVGAPVLNSQTLTLDWPTGAPEYGTFSGALSLYGPPLYRDLRVASGGQVVLVEDFTTWPGLGEGHDPTGDNRPPEIWDSQTVAHAPGSEWLAVWLGPLTARDSGWNRLTADVHAKGNSTGGDRPELGLGDDTGAYARFAVERSSRVHLVWEFTPPPGSDLEAASLETETTYPGVFALPAHLSLTNERGRLEGTVTSAVAPQLEEQTPWSIVSILGLDDVTTLVINSQTYFVEADGTLSTGPRLPARANEVRTWQGRRGSEVGACLPEENAVLVGQVPSGMGRQWPELISKTIGPAISASPPDFFATPISFDVGPDRRYYVLDAGNSRIVSFSSARVYVTEWGDWGAGEGQFNFGGGAGGDAGVGFKGSLAVDAEGYIYVADETNKRIQVFSP